MYKLSFKINSLTALIGIALCSATVGFGQSAPVITGVSSGFGARPFVSPLGLATVTGTNLGDPAGANASSVKVLVNGTQALIQGIAIDAASGTFAITFQIPPQTPLGPGTFVVSRNGVASAPFSFPISQYSPQLAGAGTTTLALLQHADGSVLDANSPAAPGEKVRAVVSGLGTALRPLVPTLMVGGFPAVVEELRFADPIFRFPGVYGMTFVVPPTLGTGNAPMSISIGNQVSATRFLPIRSTGLTVSQSGVTLRAVAGSSASVQRSISVISTSAPISWNATATTISGGNWLQVTPATGVSDPLLAPPTIQIAASAAQLGAGNYYGTVSIRSGNARQLISVALSVSPAGQSPGPTVEPTGLGFLGAPFLAPTSGKVIRVSNPTASALSFTTQLTASGNATWFTYDPIAGSIAPGAAVTITVRPNASLAAGNYSGSITLNFSDGTQRVISLLAVLGPGGSCTPTKLFTVFTLLAPNFSSPVAWPENIDAFVADDCANPITTGAVGVSFSNGDPPIGLVPLMDGHWSATWTPRTASANVTATLKAQVFNPDLTATTTLSGSAPANPKVPIVFSGGVVGTASYVASPAPGTLISIFGAELADDSFASPEIPRPARILTTQVLLNDTTLPLLFVSGGQINALVPYGLATNSTYQLIVRRGDSISTPETLAVLPAQPAVFTIDQSGKGQGHIYRATTSGQQILATSGAAVTAGDVLVVYSAGLGEVDPGSIAGTPARIDVLQRTVNPVTATIGGVNAKVEFAGLTPGFTGLYQVNLVVPPGVVPSETAELVLSAAGQVSTPATLAVR
ncbi:MAG TPA: hypothetical protein VGP79_00365 [Bryobacteraceae bacterium]|jgi:uncharacterized protein (TIGR03437 family)|nr:hypothetical protein [Bryobacteraceae bacterium]